MDIVWILVALAAVAVVFVMLRKATATSGAGSAFASPNAAHASAQAVAATSALRVPLPAAAPASTTHDVDIPVDIARDTELPESLAVFEARPASALSGARKRYLLDTFGDVPRPPRLLHHLLSPDFVSSASSAELEDLIVGEPLIAARVLSTVNSPLYGLKTQVRSIGQAVSYLGINAVRSVCLQYILIASFKADTAERERRLEATWKASALASELVQRMAQRFSMPDQGALVSAVVLSFLGRLATAASMPSDMLEAIPTRPLLARANAEQNAIGLASAEIGRLLMEDWELPRKIIDDAADIDLTLVTPFDRRSAIDPVRRARLAMCYLCARLGERLSEGELRDLREYDFLADHNVDFFHAWGYFDDARLYRLAEFFRSEELATVLDKMLGTMREPEIVV